MMSPDRGAARRRARARARQRRAPTASARPSSRRSSTCVDRRHGRRPRRSRAPRLHFEDGVVYAEPGVDVAALERRRPRRRALPRAATCSSAACRRSRATRRPASSRAAATRAAAARWRRREARSALARRRSLAAAAPGGCGGAGAPDLFVVTAAGSSRARSSRCWWPTTASCSCNGGPAPAHHRRPAPRGARDPARARRRGGPSSALATAGPRSVLQLLGAHRERDGALLRHLARGQPKESAGAAFTREVAPGGLRPDAARSAEADLAVRARAGLRALDEVQPLDRGAEQPRDAAAGARSRSAGRAGPAWRRGRSRPSPPSRRRSSRRARRRSGRLVGGLLDELGVGLACASSSVPVVGRLVAVVEELDRPRPGRAGRPGARATRNGRVPRVRMFMRPSSMRSSTSVISQRAADRPQAVVGEPHDPELRLVARGTRRSSSCSAPRRCAAARPRAGSATIPSGKRGKSRTRRHRAGSHRRVRHALSRARGVRTRADGLHRHRLVPARPARARPSAARRGARRARPRRARCSCSTRACCGGRFAVGPRGRAFLLGCLRELDAALRERGGGLVVRARARRERELAGAGAGGRRAAPSTGRATCRPTRGARDRRVRERARRGRRRGAPGAGQLRRRRRPAAHAGGQPVHGLLAVPARMGRARAADRSTARRGEIPLPGAPRRRRAAPRARRSRRRAPRSRRSRRASRRRRAALERWLARAVDGYADRHDRLAGGTSRLSPYLRLGCLSAREVEERARRARRRGRRGVHAPARAGATSTPTCCSTIPGNARHELQERYRGRWSGTTTPQLLAAWQEGRTGYPLVDAGDAPAARDAAGCTTARGSSSARS